MAMDGDDESTTVVREQRPPLKDDGYADLFLQSPVGLLVLERDGVINELNYLASELIEGNRNELLGQPFAAYLAPLSRDTFGMHLQRVFSSDERESCVVVLELGDGQRRDVELQSMATGKDSKGRRLCVTALVDITLRREAERDKKMLEKQLRQAHKMEAIGRLVAGISHDFNNLLTLIIGYSKLAMNSMEHDDSLYGYIAHINKAGNHAANLIDQLLSFSRTQSIEVMRINLNELIREMETMLRRVSGDDIELITELEEGLGGAYLDPSQMTQVMLNLVVNAREVMPDGGTITIRTDNVEFTERQALAYNLAPGMYIKLEVSDTGWGMDAHTSARIFEPFFTTKRNNKGHGFGLATTYGIITQSGGMIDVVSEVGEGSTFVVFLPRVQGETEPIGQPVEIGTESSVAAEMILIVDDQSELRDYAALVLADYDYQVLNADSPQAAVVLSEQNPNQIALVVTDITMPQLNGPELVERLREQNPGIKVLYISGYDRVTVCKERGLDPRTPFLEKPFTPEQLVNMVHQVLQR